MTELIPSRDALRRELESSLSAMRADRISRLDRRALIWLALVPAWTDRLAAACEFPIPTASSSLNDFIRQAEALGVCGRSTSTEPDGRPMLHFWMPDAVRTEILIELRRQVGATTLQREAAEIGNRIQRVRNSGDLVSPVVARWAEIASITAQGSAEGARWLTWHIRSLVDQGDTGQALAWVRTGSALAQALGGELEAAVLLGNRRLEWAYRQAQNERHLEHFLERQEQGEAFRELMTGSPDVWALHYIGMGGVGKTMLLRHIAARLAPAYQAITSRVDFDHISPDYPVRRPAQLLAELADELRLYGTTQKQDSLVQEFENRVLDLHEALSGELPAGDPLANLHRPEFDRLLRVFNDLLRVLSQPVVLILDTCEELAKLHPAGARLPSVEATFEILERIHQQVPTMRAVFAGRRLLAQSGAGWHANSLVLPAGQQHLPPQKAYLRLHEIRGFTEQEADTFLTRIERLDLRPEMRRAILDRSREIGRVAVIFADPSIHISRPSTELDLRYNPFDLALYANWLREDPNLTVDEITGGEADPYVDMRIVHRIKQPDVRKLLPAAVLLGRFDRAMIRPALITSDPAFDDAFRELTEQEWIDYQSDEALQTTFLEVDRNLHPRLFKYFRDPSRQTLLDATSRRLGPNLAQLIQTRKLSQLSVAHVDAALRLLPVDEAAALWEHIERRIPAETDWSWARTVAERILGDNGAVGIVEHPLRSAVRATHTAALIQEIPDFDVDAGWAEVANTAGAYPNSVVGEWLIQRAFAGQLAVSRLTQRHPLDEELEVFWDRLRSPPLEPVDPVDLSTHYRLEQLVASYTAALETLAETAESTGDHRLAPDPLAVREWLARLEMVDVSPDLRSFAYTLAGRAYLLGRRWEEAVAVFRQVADMLPPADGGTRPLRWGDWRAPSSLRDRVRLELLRAHLPGFDVSAQQLAEWQKEAFGRLRLIDGERLVSLILLRRLADGLAPAEELEATAQVERYSPDRQPVCNAHRAVPPLVITLALGELALARVDRASALLEQRLNAATQSGRDDLSARAAERTLAQVFRRMRVSGPRLAAVGRLARSEAPEDAEVGWATLAVNAPESDRSIPPPEMASSPQLIHAWWRSQETVTGRGAVRSLEVMRAYRQGATQLPPTAATDVALLSLELDWEEAALVAEQHRIPQAGSANGENRPRAGSLAAPGLLERIEVWQANHPTQPAEAFRLRLRADVLMGRRLPGSEWVASVGFRRMAELALDEGELLALRLPAHAAQLLEQASFWFSSASDPVGDVIANIRGVVARVHHGDAAGAQRMLDVTRASYQRLRASETTLPQPELPSWDSLIALLDADEAEYGVLDHPSWSGWLSRLVTCLVWSVEPSGVGPRTARLRSWLQSRYGERLPLELDLRDMTAGADPERQGGVSTRRGSATTVQRMLVPMAGIGLIVVAVYVAYVSFAWLIRRDIWSIFWPDGPPPVFGYSIWHILLYAAIGGLLFMSPRWFRAARGVVRSFLAERTMLRLDIITAPARTTETIDLPVVVPVTMTLSRRDVALRLAWPPLQRQALTKIENAGQTPGLGTYAAAASGVPRPIVDELSELSERLGLRAVPVPLQIQPALAAIPWEAILVFALPPALIGDSVRRLQFWRTGERRPSPAQIAILPPIAVQVVSSPTWSLLAERGWGQLDSDVMVSDILDVPPGSKQVKILHLIGTAIQTTTGLRLQIGGPSYDASQAQTKSRRLTEQAMRGDVLLRADPLPYREVPLVVVQADPTDTRVRLNTEREQTATLRAFAAEIFAAGAGSVLLLPALAPELAEAVLAHIAAQLRGSGAVGPQPLLKLTTEVRQMIAAGHVASASQGQDAASNMVQSSAAEDEQTLAGSRLESALDVCLFTRLSFLEQDNEYPWMRRTLDES